MRSFYDAPWASALAWLPIVKFDFSVFLFFSTRFALSLHGRRLLFSGVGRMILRRIRKSRNIGTVSTAMLVMRLQMDATGNLIRCR
jgi:hypothetical protein